MKKVAITTFFIFLVSLFNQSLFAQMPNTYALIIGVAKYKHQNIKHLKFADDDALAFKAMLQSPAGGKVKSENIKCFINDSATISNIIGSYRWMQNTPKSGERMIIYFSGHGDAINPELVYLLPYDADASDPNNYDFTALNMYRLKSLIKELKMKGVEVILITDACRTNEISGATGSSIYAYESIVNKDFGEIKLNSCSADQESAEDLRWGGGHGVFTHYLLQGWMGMANEDEDDKITAGELFRYVTRMVKKDRYDPKESKTMQTPSSCCSMHEDIVLAKIDHETLKRLKEVEDGIVVPDDVYAYVTTKSGGDAYEEDTVVMRLFNNIIGAIEKGNIIQPKSNCAYSYYEELKKLAGDRPIFYDAESELLAALNAKGQNVLNLFLNGSASNYNSNVFKTAYEYMEKALEILPADDYYYGMFKSKALFLESQFLMFRESTRHLAMDKIDSAITLSPRTAYLYFSKGMIYDKYLMFDSALVYYSKAIELAPKWSAPYEEKTDILLDFGQTDSAVACMKKLINSSDRGVTQLVMGDFYYSIDSLDLAIAHYHKAIEKDSTLVDAHNGLFVCYRFQGKDSLSRIYQDKSEKFSTEEDEFYDMYAAYYEKVGDYEKAAEYYNYLYLKDTANLHFRLRYAEMIYAKGDVDQAADIFIELVDLDPYFLETYYTLYNLFKEAENYESAIWYGKYLLEVDPGFNPANLYFPYYKLDMLDSANYFLQMANKKFPNKKLTVEWMAYNHLLNNHYAEAITIYENLGRRYSKTGSIFYNLAFCYDQTNQGAKCIGAMERALTADKYNIGYYKQMVNYLWTHDARSKTKIVHWLMFPWENFRFQGQDYVRFAAYHLTYTEDTDALLTMCQLGLENYPEDYHFHLYAALYHIKTGNMDAFYDSFKTAMDKGLGYSDIEEYDFILPDPEKDKKYRKISKNLYPR